MNIIIDLVGAILIGGMVLLLTVNLNTTSTQYKFASDYELRLQQNAKTLAEIINSDMRKIGYKKTGGAFISALENKLSFYSDIDSNGVQDIVTYCLSDSTKALFSENPRDKILYRVINTDTLGGPSLGLTNLKFSFKNKNGLTTTYLDSIKYVKIEIWVETTERINNQYPFTYWEMTINPRNI